MKKVHLGLDLGVASVGWSLVDEDQNIIATGSHLFPKLSDPKDNNKYGEGERGNIRRIRRMNNRKKQRKIDFLNMIDLYNDNNQNKIKETKDKKHSSLYKKQYQDLFGFNKDYSSSDFLFNDAKKYDVYKIWEKGLKGEIKPKELFAFLYFKLGMRGVFFKDFKFDDNKKYTFEDSLLKNVFINDYFLKSNKFRNQSNGDSTFSIYWNWKDIETVLKNQSYIPEEFIRDYKDIFMRHRFFAYGPGSQKSPSIWGVNEFDENGNPLYPLWETKIGFCPVSFAENKGDELKTEKRLSEYHFISELSNIISQLVYVRIVGSASGNNEYLNKEQIIKLINRSIIDNKKINLKMICDVVGSGVDKNNIKGFPTDKEDKTKPNFEPLLKLRKYVNEYGLFIFDKFDIENSWETLVEIDSKRFEVIKKYYEDQTVKGAKTADDKQHNKEVRNNINFEESLNVIKDNLDYLQNLPFKINYENLVNFNSIRETDISGTRNFGPTAYNKYLQEFFNNDKFNKSISHYYKNELHSAKRYLYRFNSDSKYLPESMFNKQDFISPNARNTIKEAIRVINRALKMYVYKNKDLELESIILETTYDSDSLRDSLLSKQAQEEISNYQNYRENLRKEAIQEMKRLNIPDNGQNIERMMLWKEQNGIDVYSGESIVPQKIIDAQIDHIIPITISFNNNWDNKVLTLQNSYKGQKSPHQWLKKEKYDALLPKWKEIYKIKDSKDDKENKKEIDGSKKKSSKSKDSSQRFRNLKFKNLTMDELELYNKNFINSNLSETTYAVSKLKEGLDYWFEQIQEENKLSQLSNCEIRTLSGYQSQLLRTKVFELPEKDRSISNHHSHDASMLAMYSSIDIVNDFYRRVKDKDNGRQYVLDRIRRFKNQSEKDNQKEFMSISKLSSYLGEKSKQIRKMILDSKCLYSFKKISILSKDFENKSIEEKWEEIKSIKPKKIFQKETIFSYKEIEGNKYKIVKLNLTSDDDSKYINQIFIDLYLTIKQSQLKSDKEILKLINDFSNSENKKKFQRILTSKEIMFDLYKHVSPYLDKNYEDGKTFKKSIFSLANSEISKDTLNLTEKNGYKNINISDEKYKDNILNNYVPVIKDNKLTKVKSIKIIDPAQYEPTFEKKDSSRKINNQIFSIERQNTFFRNYSQLGNNSKFFILLKYLDNKNKTKIDIFKINELNNIIDSPHEDKILEILTFIDPNKWYLIENEIYRISNFGDGKLEIMCVSNNELNKINKSSGRIIGTSKSFSSWSNSIEGREQEIFRKIICQGKEIKL